MAGTVAFIGSAGVGTPLWVSSANPLPVTGGTGGSSAPYAATPAAGGSQFGLAVPTATTLTVPAAATYAYITVEGTDVRWTDDGTTPTTTVGALMSAGQPPLLFSGNLATAKFIQTAASATINVQYYH